MVSLSSPMRRNRSARKGSPPQVLLLAALCLIQSALANVESSSHAGADSRLLQGRRHVPVDRGAHARAASMAQQRKGGFQIFSTGDGSGSSYTSSYLSASGTLQPVTSVVFAAMTECTKSYTSTTKLGFKLYASGSSSGQTLTSYLLTSSQWYSLLSTCTLYNDCLGSNTTSSACLSMVLDADCLTTLDTTSSMYTYRRVSTLTTSLARYSRNSTASSSGTGFYWLHASTSPVTYGRLSYVLGSKAVLAGVPGSLPGAMTAYHGFVLGSTVWRSSSLETYGQYGSLQSYCMGYEAYASLVSSHSLVSLSSSTLTAAISVSELSSLPSESFYSGTSQYCTKNNSGVFWVLANPSYSASVYVSSVFATFYDKYETDNRNTSVNWGSKFGQASIVPAFICVVVLLAMRLRSIINRNCGFGKGQKCWAGWRNKDESDGIEVSASGAMLVSRDEQGLVSVLRVEDHDVMAGRAVERTDALTAKRLFFGGRVYLEDKLLSADPSDLQLGVVPPRVWRRDFCLYEFNQHELLSMVLADEHNPFSTGERAAMWFTKKSVQFMVAALVSYLVRSNGLPSALSSVLQIVIVIPVEGALSTTLFYLYGCPCLNVKTKGCKRMLFSCLESCGKVLSLPVLLLAAGFLATGGSRPADFFFAWLLGPIGAAVVAVSYVFTLMLFSLSPEAGAKVVATFYSGYLTQQAYLPAMHLLKFLWFAAFKVKVCGVTVAEFGQWRKELMVHLLRSHKQDPLSPSMAAINQRFEEKVKREKRKCCGKKLSEVDYLALQLEHAIIQRCGVTVVLFEVPLHITRELGLKDSRLLARFPDAKPLQEPPAVVQIDHNPLTVRAKTEVQAVTALQATGAASAAGVEMQQQPAVMAVMAQQNPAMMMAQQPVMVMSQQPVVMTGQPAPGQQQPVMVMAQQPMMVGPQPPAPLGQQGPVFVMGQQPPGPLMGQAPPTAMGQQGAVMAMGQQSPVMMMVGPQPVMVMMGQQPPGALMGQQPVMMMGQPAPGVPMGQPTPVMMMGQQSPVMMMMGQQPPMAMMGQQPAAPMPQQPAVGPTPEPAKVEKPQAPPSAEPQLLVLPRKVHPKG